MDLLVADFILSCTLFERRLYIQPDVADRRDVRRDIYLPVFHDYNEKLFTAMQCILRYYA